MLKVLVPLMMIGCVFAPLSADLIDVDHMSTGDPNCSNDIHGVETTKLTICGGDLDFFGTPYHAIMEMQSQATLTSFKSRSELREVTLPDGFQLVAVNDKEIIRAMTSITTLTNLTITGATGNGVLRLTYDIDGSFETSGSSDFQGAALLVVDGGGQRLGMFQYSSRDSTFPNDSGVLIVDLPFTFDAPVALSQSFTTFTSGFFLGASGPVHNARATTDYFNTVNILPVTVFDANMQQVTGASVTSDGGFQFAVNGSTAAVPEPSTTAVAAAAMLALFIRLRRRRR